MKYFEFLKRIVQFLYIYLIVLFSFLRIKLTTGNFFFAQVGANDGKSGDPFFYLVNLLKWKGIMFEPVPYVFEKLKNNYKNNKNIHLENKALTLETGKLNFYYLKKSNNPKLPQWYDQIGSFNLDVLKKHKSSIPDFDNLLTHAEVKTTNFDEIIKKYKLKNIDLIFIDTEGYDAEIIYSLDLEVVSPHIINFEHTHLSSTERETLYRYLEDKGFSVVFHGNSSGDSTAYMRQIFSKILP